MSTGGGRKWGGAGWGSHPLAGQPLLFFSVPHPDPAADPPAAARPGDELPVVVEDELEGPPQPLQQRARRSGRGARRRQKEATDGGPRVGVVERRPNLEGGMGW